jgi:hypothetical protein
MRRNQARKITNPMYQRGDPRRNEPGPNSIKRIGAGWRERWHRTLDPAHFKSTDGK